MRKLLPLVALPFFAVPAAAQSEPVCNTYDAIVAVLASEYGEVPVARMLDGRGFVVEVLASADGKTYTMLAVAPDMSACVLSTGAAFSTVTTASVTAPGVQS